MYIEASICNFMYTQIVQKFPNVSCFVGTPVQVWVCFYQLQFRKLGTGSPKWKVTVTVTYSIQYMRLCTNTLHLLLSTLYTYYLHFTLVYNTHFTSIHKTTLTFSEDITGDTLSTLSRLNIFGLSSRGISVHYHLYYLFTITHGLSLQKSLCVETSTFNLTHTRFTSKVSQCLMFCQGHKSKYRSCF